MSYQIADEPIPTTLNQYAVRPSLPLFSVMVAGTWLAWPWFAFNAFALGSPTKKKELALVGLAFGGTALLAVLVVALVRAGILPPGIPTRLAVLGIVTFKLTMSYYIAVVQERTFHVYEYYGGSVRNATIVLTLAYYLRPLVLGISDDPIWIIIVAGGL